MIVAQILGPKWSLMAGVQTAQGLLCEARKYYSSSKVKKRTPGSPQWYTECLEQFAAALDLPLHLKEIQQFTALPQKPNKYDGSVLERLCNFFAAMVWRFRRSFCTCSAESADLMPGPGVQQILLCPRFHQQKILQWNWRLDRSSLRLWSAVSSTVHKSHRLAEWPHGHEVPAPAASPQNMVNVVLTTVAHVLLPCRELGFLTPQNLEDQVVAALNNNSPFQHPYGRAVDQAVKGKQERE